MVKVRSSRRPGSALAWLIAGLLAIPIGVLLLGAVLNLTVTAGYLWYLASRATVFDTWAVLNIASALMSLVAVVGAGFALKRWRMGLALAFAVLTLPVTFVIEGSRCDTFASCRALSWAALPAGAFDWEVRHRSVTDPNEAERLASGLLWKTGSKDSPFRTKRFGDHWIVSTINDDGWPGARAVRIDTRTGRTTLVSCPQSKIQCGMERPTVSDGRRVYRNAELGLAAVFPTSRPVCAARDDDGAPRGFFAMVRSADIPCDSLDPSREIGVEVARWRLNGCTVTEAPSLAWRPLSPETARLFKGRPSLGGRVSSACELHDGDHIQISVYASVARGSRPEGPPDVVYEGYMVTTPAHLAEDVRTFELFLQGVTLGG
ncbi:MAG: hypothetical protein EON89_15480 [Brevundimonas sp.]|nr:MAG: hypothetical protein EON89_15480 [Brevundimonas sp.]